MGPILIRLAYGVMIVGIILCFVFSRNHEKDVRKAATQFAFAFAKLSNFISPKPPKEGLLVQELPGGGVSVLPLEEQPESIRRIVERANASQSVKLFAELDTAAASVSKQVSANRTHKAQFQAPIDQLLLLAQTFLRGCEDLSYVNSQERKAAFDSFLMEQPEHRMVLLKRISGESAEEYRKLNKRYASEMERIEAEELEAKQKGGKKQRPAKQKQQAPEASPAAQDSLPPTGPESPAQEPPQAEEPPKTEEPASLKDEWRGWGCG